jgi:hypothetical protein
MYTSVGMCLYAILSPQVQWTLWQKKKKDRTERDSNENGVRVFLGGGSEFDSKNVSTARGRNRLEERGLKPGATASQR